MHRTPADVDHIFPRIKREFVRGLVVSASLLCVAIAVWWAADKREGFNSSQLKWAAFVGACLTAFYAAYTIWELRDPTPGLVIDREGLVENMTTTPMGRIPWSDIAGFHIDEQFGTRCVVVDVVDPQKYIKRFGWPKWAPQLVTELAGSPIMWEGKAIGLTPEELLSVLSEAHRSYGHGSATGQNE